MADIEVVGGITRESVALAFEALPRQPPEVIPLPDGDLNTLKRHRERWSKEGPWWGYAIPDSRRVLLADF